MLPGNIADVTTIKKLIYDIEELNIKNPRCILDRGFYSSDNINLLYKNNIHFIISLRKNLKFVKEIYKEAKNILLDQLSRYKCFDSILNIYSVTREYLWDYVEKNEDDQIILKIKRRIYIHIFYNEERGTKETRNFLITLDTVKALLFENKSLNDNDRNIVKKIFNNIK